MGWLEAHAALSAIRRRVFIEEQGVPEALEWDGLDAEARHFLARAADGSPIGCARLLAGCRIGRMAVLPEWRGRGVGHALLQAVIAECRRQGCVEVRLSAQVTAMAFYQRAGFVPCSAAYLDAGMLHRDMVLC